MVKNSNTACAPIIRIWDLEKNVIPDIIIAMAFETINKCFT
jgi:hypothetical protein